MSRITPCLWYDGAAEEAARFYVSLLPDSRIDTVFRNPVDTPGGAAGGVLMVAFTLAGQSYTALNGGPGFPHGNAVSFMITCADQAEIDRVWSAILDGGGKAVQCGWITDRWGVPWQILPAGLMDLLAEPERAGRVMAALMEMVKLDVAALEAA